MTLRGRSEIGGEIGAIVRRAARSTRGAIDEHVLRTMSAFAIAIDGGRARNRDQRGAQSSDERARRTIAPLVNRRLSLLARWTIAPLVDHRLSLLPLSLSDLGSLFSLSLSLSLSLSFSGNDLN